MRGRKPVPTQIQVLHGNPSKNHINKDEPIPVGELADPPEWLTEGQKAAWRHVLANAPRGLLRRLDSGVLTVWVVAEDTHRIAAEQLALTPSLLLRAPAPPKTKDNPNPYQPPPYPSPYVGLMSRQALIMMKAASELGFSPAARARVFAVGRPSDPLPIAPLAVEKGKERAKVPLREYLANAPTRGLMN
jgi:P27 family predicted phage terminase small subunit